MYKEKYSLFIKKILYPRFQPNIAENRMKKISDHSRHVARLCSIYDFGEVTLTEFYFDCYFFNNRKRGETENTKYA